MDDDARAALAEARADLAKAKQLKEEANERVRQLAGVRPDTLQAAGHARAGRDAGHGVGQVHARLD